MRNALLSVALLAAAAAVVLAGDKKLPKKPDRPFSVAITSPPKSAPTTEAETRAAKEVTDSLVDIRNSLRDKRKAWFTLVDDPEQAEIILEVGGRAGEAGHGLVIRGRAFVLGLEPFPVLGQGGLNPNSLDFRVWRQAANDITERLQVFCQSTYDDISASRKRGVRPLAVIQNDRGIDLYKHDKDDEALVALGEAIRLAPTFALPRFNRGLVLSTRKDYEHAILDFDETLRLEPTHTRANLFRGVAYRERGMLEPARADFDAAVRMGPKDGDAYLARGGLLMTLGDQRGAIPDLDQAVALSSSKGEALAQRGYAYQALGEKDKALLDLDAALAAGFKTPALYYNRGRMLDEKNDPSACEAFYKAALLDKTDADLRFEKGLCDAKNGLLETAITEFSEVIRLKPDRAEAWWNRGLCYGKQKKVRQASADRAQALKLDPKLAGKK